MHNDFIKKTPFKNIIYEKIGSIHILFGFLELVICQQKKRKKTKVIFQNKKIKNKFCNQHQEKYNLFLRYLLRNAHRYDYFLIGNKVW